MATTQDIAELKAQFDERIGTLRESFGVVEADVNELGHFSHDFTFTSLEAHQSDDNMLKDLASQVHAKSAEFLNAAQAEELLVKTQLELLHSMFTDGQTQLDGHIQQHLDAHHVFQDAAQSFAGSIEQVSGEADHAREQYIAHVTDMHQTLTGLAEKVFGSATALDHSVREAQTEALNKAATEFHSLIDSHLQGHLPSTFQETAQQLTQHVHDLGQHATAAGDNLQHELATFLADMTHYAQQEVHDKIEQKFQQLIHEALAFILQEIEQTIMTTTIGVTTTTALSPFIPELAILKKVLDGLKEAIKIFKTLEEIF